MLSIRTAPRRSGGDVSFLNIRFADFFRQKSRSLWSGSSSPSAFASSSWRLSCSRPGLGIQYVPNDKVGIKESLWGKHIEQGRIIALKGETGFQPDVLRGGIYFGLLSLEISDSQSSAGRDSAGKDRLCLCPRRRSTDRQPNAGPHRRVQQFSRCPRVSRRRRFDESAFGQRGRQRAVLREGVYAINLALFTVIAEDQFYSLGTDRAEIAMLRSWQEQLESVDGFNPIVIGAKDDIGIVTVQDGPVLPSGEIIAPAASERTRQLSKTPKNSWPPAACAAGNIKR